MRASKPNREGWMTEALAEAPACPPFPDFTDFEQRALGSTAPLFAAKANAFCEQVASAEVVDRINTIVGFYTRVRVDRAKCDPVPLRGQGAHFEVVGIEHGLGTILWDADGDGYLETIEGWTVGESRLEGVALADLEFIRLTQLG